MASYGLENPYFIIPGARVRVGSIFLSEKFGFIVNYERFSLTPSTTFEHLGFINNFAEF